MILKRLILMMCLTLMLGAEAHAISREQAVKQARQKVPGRVLKAEPSHNSSGYRVKILQPDGRVKSVLIQDRKAGPQHKPKGPARRR